MYDAGKEKAETAPNAQKINETTEKLAETPRDSYLTIVDHVVWL